MPIAERRVPIIADERVDPEFGTGALKITPGTTRWTWEIGRDHDLPEPMVIGLDGRMNEERGRARRPDSGRGREADRRGLTERGLLEKRESFRHSVGHCDRSGDRIEPLVLLQWWVEMDGAGKQPAIAALRDGRVRSHPEQQTGVMLSFLENIRPLVHLAAALVGSPDSRLVLRRRAHDGGRERARRRAPSAGRPS